MSSCDVYELDADFVEELHTGTLDPRDIAYIIEVWEPFRNRIETVLDQFEEDEMSWRDFRNNAFDFLPNVEFDKEGRVVRESHQHNFVVTGGQPGSFVTECECGEVEVGD